MLDRIDKLMPNSLQRGGIARQVKVALVADTVAECLAEHFGAEMAQQMTVRRVKEKTASIRCDSSVLAEEIRLAEPELLRLIEEKLAGRSVERLIATS